MSQHLLRNLSVAVVVVARPVLLLQQPVLPPQVQAAVLPAARPLDKLVQFLHLPAVRNPRLQRQAVAAVRAAEPLQALRL